MLSLRVLLASRCFDHAACCGLLSTQCGMMSLHCRFLCSNAWLASSSWQHRWYPDASLMQMKFCIRIAYAAQQADFRSVLRFLMSGDTALHDALGASMGPGVLEIKCPFNRGQPESASVPSLPPWYYMPQVMQQGLYCCNSYDGATSSMLSWFRARCGCVESWKQSRLESW